MHNSAHSTILFLFKPASPTGIGGRSKVNKKVPVREPLPTSCDDVLSRKKLTVKSTRIRRTKYE